MNPGEEVWLRWTDVNNAGNDSGLGVDGVNVTFSATALPEPGTLPLTVLALPLLGALALRQQRRRK